jgi:hypothetical protein
MCQALGISADELLGLEVSEQRAADHLARETARLVAAVEQLTAATRAGGRSTTILSRRPRH